MERERENERALSTKIEILGKIIKLCVCSRSLSRSLAMPIFHSECDAVV